METPTLCRPCLKTDTHKHRHSHVSTHKINSARKVGVSSCQNKILFHAALYNIRPKRSPLPAYTIYAHAKGQRSAFYQFIRCRVREREGEARNHRRPRNSCYRYGNFGARAEAANERERGGRKQRKKAKELIGALRSGLANICQTHIFSDLFSASRETCAQAGDQIQFNFPAPLCSLYTIASNPPSALFLQPYNARAAFSLWPRARATD